MIGSIKEKIIGLYGDHKEKLVKALVAVVIILFGVIVCNVAMIGISEIQTLYFHILMVLLWLGTSALGIWLYGIFSIPRALAEGKDKDLNQVERLTILKIHTAIILASAILVFSSTFIYYGKKSDEMGESIDGTEQIN
ncbi:MAG: hypothetical protein LBO69_02185 [Ignavibacteria bacterium]|jgi:Na+/proline symporter|nr:hypothetical protein [Ignavibacteria bacterium]